MQQQPPPPQPQLQHDKQRGCHFVADAHEEQKCVLNHQDALQKTKRVSGQTRNDVVPVPQTTHTFLGWDRGNTAVLVLALADAGVLRPLSSIELMPSPHKPISRPQILLKLWEPDIIHVLKTAAPKDFDDQFYEWAPEWKQLKAPLTAPRPRGVPALRHVANQEGTAIVVSTRRPSNEFLQRAVEFSYGTNVVYALDDGSQQFREKQNGFEILPYGLVLHPGNAPRLANCKRGRVNPHIGWGDLHGQLNKWTEYLFAERTQRGIMAKTVRSDMLGFWQNPANQKMAAQARDCVLRLGLPCNAGIRTVQDASCVELHCFYRQFFEALHGEFPDGAYLKHIGSCGTFATNQLVTSFNSNPDAMIDDFLDCALGELAKWHTSERNRPSDPQLDNSNEQHSAEDLKRVQTFLMKAIEQTERPVPMFIWYNVADPTKTIIQQRLELAVTPLSQWPLEFRVDFVDGEPVSIFPRHCYEYFPESLTSKVGSFVRDFFAAAEQPYRYLCGAADVAFISDGSLRIIEFNFGAESGFIGPDIWGNTYLSKLLGRQTPLMQALEELFQSSVDGQKEVLKHILSKTEDRNFFHEGFGLTYWLRDRYLAAFEMDPSAEKARQIMSDLRNLFSVVCDSQMCDHVDHLIKGALSFMNLTETD